MTEPSNVTTEANRAIIRQAFDDWVSGTRAINDVFAADMVWRIEGHSLASKTYADKQQFIDEVIDGTAFYDSISSNDLWTRVQPRR